MSVIFLTAYIIWILLYDLTYRAEKEAEIKTGREKIKGKGAWTIQDVGLAFFLQNKANEISIWLFEGLQRLPKVTERQGFDEGNGIHYCMIVGKHCWLCLSAE